MRQSSVSEIDKKDIPRGSYPTIGDKENYPTYYQHKQLKTDLPRKPRVLGALANFVPQSISQRSSPSGYSSSQSQNSSVKFLTPTYQNQPEQGRVPVVPGRLPSWCLSHVILSVSFSIFLSSCPLHLAAAILPKSWSPLTTALLLRNIIDLRCDTDGEISHRSSFTRDDSEGSIRQNVGFENPSQSNSSERSTYSEVSNYSECLTQRYVFTGSDSDRIQILDAVREYMTSMRIHVAIRRTIRVKDGDSFGLAYLPQVGSSCQGDVQGGSWC